MEYIKFYVEITSNFKVTLKGPAEENWIKICYPLRSEIFFLSNNNHIFGQKTWVQQ